MFPVRLAGTRPSAACPSCGAPLYRQTRTGPDPGNGLPEDDDARLGEDPTRRAVPRGLAIAIAVALAIVAVASIEQRFGDASPARPVASNPEVGSGALVYLARDDGRARVGRRPARGGRRARPDRPSGHGGAGGRLGCGVGVGRRRASCGPPDGRGLRPAGCRYERRRRRARSRRPGRVGTGRQEPRVRSERAAGSCRMRAGPHQPGDRGYRTGGVGAGRSRVLRAGSVAQPERRRHLLHGGIRRSPERVPDRDGRGAAPDLRRARDHLRIPSLGVPPVARVPSSCEGEPSSGTGTLLGWKGIGGPVTVGSGEHVLAIERILSWSTDGSRVALVGALGARRGVFVLDAGSGSATRVPRYVMPAEPDLDGTFDGRGRLYLVASGEVFVADDGRPVVSRCRRERHRPRDRSSGSPERDTRWHGSRDRGCRSCRDLPRGAVAAGRTSDRRGGRRGGYAGASRALPPRRPGARRGRGGDGRRGRRHRDARRGDRERLRGDGQGGCARDGGLRHPRERCDRARCARGRSFGRGVHPVGASSADLPDGGGGRRTDPRRILRRHRERRGRVRSASDWLAMPADARSGSPTSASRCITRRPCSRPTTS